MSDRKNSEGYSDPTAYQAMMNLEIEELRFKKLLRSIKDMCDEVEKCLTFLLKIL